MVMGWGFDELQTKNVQEKKMLKMVGESLHLGCIGSIVFLIFLADEGPWWSAPKLAQAARPVLVDRASSSTAASPKAPKRARRTGVVSLVRGPA